MNQSSLKSALAAVLLLAHGAVAAQDATETLANRLIKMRGQVDE